MPDHFAGEVYLADYLLYRLNRERMFAYVDELSLPGPTDDVRYLAAHTAAMLEQKRRLPGEVVTTRVTSGAQFFLQLFRKGCLGKLCLDYLPSKGEVSRLKALRIETEPPGPWGPPAYPEIPLGLELDRNGPILPAGFEPRSRRDEETD